MPGVYMLRLAFYNVIRFDPVEAPHGSTRRLDVAST